MKKINRLKIRGLLISLIAAMGIGISVGLIVLETMELLHINGEVDKLKFLYVCFVIAFPIIIWVHNRILNRFIYSEMYSSVDRYIKATNDYIEAAGRERDNRRKDIKRMEDLVNKIKIINTKNEQPMTEH